MVPPPLNQEVGTGRDTGEGERFHGVINTAMLDGDIYHQEPNHIRPHADGDTNPSAVDVDNIVLGGKQDTNNHQSHHNNNQQLKQRHLGPSSGDAPAQQRHSVAVQTATLVPYRLRVWPGCCRGVADGEDGRALVMVSSTNGLHDGQKPGRFMAILRCFVRTLSQWLLSQLGLTLVLVLWALLGAFAFYTTEGPREQEQADTLRRLKRNYAVDVATDLRQVSADHLDTWPTLIERYLDRYEAQLLEAVSAGFGEGGDAEGSIWTYPGCVLFAVSILTTLGFGAPVPRTSLARGAVVLFSAIGIPLHFLLIINIGNLASGILQGLASNKQALKSIEAETSEAASENVEYSTAPATNMTKSWLKWFPFFAIVFYYTLGVSTFGFARSRSAVDSLMFPLDFTASGGVATTSGHVRILYALYLEGAVTLAAVIVSLVQASATRGIIDLGLRLGLVTNS